MRAKFWRRLLGPLALAVLAGLALSDSALAQQTGMLPLAPIRRKRPPCDQEDQVYRIYREQYYGYHPTLWRPFPSGWGAPSPEAPNRAASFQKIPLDEPPAWMGGGEEGELPEEGAEDEGQPGQVDAPRPNLPNPPPENVRSPFEMDDPDMAPDLDTPPAQAPAPRPQPAVPDLPDDDPNRSPFDPRAGARPDPTSPPDLSVPDLAPAAARNGRVRRSSEIDADQAGSPLLAMPDTDFDRPYRAQDLGRPAAASPTTEKAQAQPPRRSRLASMMSGLGWTASRR